MAALINPPQRYLLEYLSDTSESAEVRAGSPLPLGTQESGGGVNFAIFLSEEMMYQAMTKPVQPTSQPLAS
jgi:hypothetical protein